MKRIAVFATQLLLSGCVAQNDGRLKKVTELDASVTALGVQLKAAEAQIQSLETDVWLLKAQAQPYKTATFDPGSPGGYSRLDTTAGTLLVSIQNVTPYLDGFRVTCNFGNPSSATLNGIKLKARWGTRLDVKDKEKSPGGWVDVKEKKTDFGQWQASLREKELSLTESLQPGSWNRVSFALSPAKPEEFGYLELSIETDNVSLRK